ncbi:hippurate hydrolase [Methylovorus glucosotrophus]|jgi:amidohydrolase|uniref:M20 aminoacylase family protein n=1 Tax=Methylovorus glucosotrophus TaxID=266009 RepID=UPI001ED55FDF|nr:M20 aminoacylase family protein [Methylovorus glucosotrophus]KAF0842852.1 hippurate hydrolase [Methylovorus glucosotrophus]
MMNTPTLASCMIDSVESDTIGQEDFSVIRRSLHAWPEIGFEEINTSQLIAEKLRSWGIEVHCGIGGTGVVGVIHGRDGGKRIGLRADMDALKIEEDNQFAHRSRNPGKMHACGHDGHVAMLLSAAKTLAASRNFYGKVNLIFQPAEEGGSGAEAMIADGLFDRFPCDAIFALHNWPGLKTGDFATCPGPIMASCNEFRIRITGKGTHAALPHLGNDPIFAATQIVSGLQAVITRNKRPIDNAVLSITQLQAGTSFNVIPDTASIGGTVRTFSDKVLDMIEARMRSISILTAEAHGCRAEFDFIRQSGATINDEVQTELAGKVMRKVAGAGNVDTQVEPTMGAEDFSTMLRLVPGCYAFIGNGNGEHRASGHGLGSASLHNASYDFNDALIPLGSRYWVALAEEFCSQEK